MRIRTLLLWTLGVLLLLAVAVRLLLDTDRVRNWVGSLATGSVPGLEIGRFTGDLAHGFVLTEVRYADSTLTVTIDTLKVRYRLWPLIGGTVRVDTMAFAGLDVIYRYVATPTDTAAMEPLPVDLDIRSVTIRRGSATLTGVDALPDSLRSVRDLHFDGAGSYVDAVPWGEIRDLRFRMASVSVSAAGSEDRGLMTLERLVVAFGRNAFEATGWWNRHEERLDLAAAALWDGTITLDADLTGPMSELRLGVRVSAPGARNVVVDLEGSMAGAPTVTGLRLVTGAVRPDSLPALAGLPAWRQAGADFRGALRLDSIARSEGEAAWSVAGLRGAGWRVDRLAGDATLREGRLTAPFTARAGAHTVRASLSAADPFGDRPAWAASLSAAGLDAGAFLTGPAPSTDLSFRFDACGAGLRPDDSWAASFRLHDSRIDSQSIRDLTLATTVSNRVLRLTGALTLRRNPTPITASWHFDDAGTPFTAAVDLVRFNLAGIEGFEPFPTILNGRLEVAGNSRSGSWAFDGAARLGISDLNGSTLDSLHAPFSFRNGQLVLLPGFLRSDIADAGFSGVRNLADPLHVGNLLQIDLTLKDPHPLAVLVGADRLEATGSLTASLAPTPAGQQVTARWRFDDIVYDQLHLDRLSGAIDGWVADSLTYRLETTADMIRYQGRIIQKLELAGRGGFRNATHIIRGDRLDLRLDGHAYDLAHAFTIRHAPEASSLDSLVLAGESDAQVWVSGRMIGGRLEAEGAIRSGDVRTLLHLAGDDTPASGRLHARFRLASAGDSLRADADLRFEKLSIRNFALDHLDAAARLDDHRITLSANGIRHGSTWLTLAADLPYPLEAGPESLSGQLLVEPFPLDSAAALFQSFGYDPIPGVFRMAARLDGTAAEPRISGSGALTASRLGGVPVDSIGIGWQGDPRTDRLALNGVWMSSGQKAAVLGGTIPFGPDMQTGNLDLRLTTTDFDLRSAAAFTDPAVVRQPAGRLDADLRIGGTMETPVLTGTTRLSRASLQLVQAGITVQDISAELDFEPGRIRLSRFRAVSNGELTAQGAIGISGATTDTVAIRIRAQRFQAANTRQAQAFVNLDARLSGTWGAPVLTGIVDLERGRFQLDEFGAGSVEDITLEGETADSTDLFDRTRLEMRLTTDGGFHVLNRSGPEMDLELDGELDLVKDVGGPLMLFGSMGTSRGTVTQLGKPFVLERGNAQFDGDPENPELDIRALYALRQPSDVRIWYVIGGSLEEPGFRYESDPEMELQDIISYTLFSRPFNALSGLEQTLSGASGTGNPALDLLGDRVGDMAARRLGLDVVQIDNTRSGGGTGTTIRAGKYVNDRLFVAILQELGNTTGSQIIFEYALRQNLNLVITGSDSRKTGIDIQWKYDY